MARAVNVLGMHRSGTSLAARALNLLGLDLGGEAGFTTPGRKENPKGFWERGAIKDLNDELLAELGGSWSEPPELEPGWERASALDGFRERARRLIEEEFSGAELFGWKDPRSSILLPLWQQVVPGLTYVICLRHPDGVARSLLQRGTPTERGEAHRLWLRYTTAALANTRGSRRQFVFFEDFFEDLDRQVDALARFLDLKPQEVAEDARGAIRSLADPALYRNRTGPDDDGRLPPEVRGLWVALRATAPAEAQLAEDPFAAADTESSLRALERSVDARREQEAAHAAELSGTHAQLAEAQHRLRAAEAKAESAARELKEAERIESALREDLRSVEESFSWRVTKPIRAVKRVASRPRSKRRLRKSADRAGDEAGPSGGGRAGEAAERHPLEDLHIAPPVTIIIPVFNASGELAACLDSVLRNTTLRVARLLVIDDASTDPEVAGVLSTLEGLSGVDVLRNGRNLGFTATVNRGIRESAGSDIVLLNSDTQVGPRWIENLRMAAYASERTGTATAVSDHAGAFSVPEIDRRNQVPDGLGTDGVARLVTQAGEGRLPRTPTGNGFCLYMKRAMIDDVGVFDEETFPRGYGEENEQAMRAGARGWGHVVDDRTFVHHRRAASFGEEKAELSRVGREAIDRLYPGYTKAVREFVRSKEMAAVRASVARAFAAPEPPRPRILFVVHQGGGGAPATNTDLMGGLADRWDPLALTSDMKTLRLWHPSVSAEPVGEWQLESAWAPAEFSRPDFRRVAWEVLAGYGIELVHLRHLFKHSLDLPTVARVLEIPIVTSFHDFYLSCPTVHLLDENEVHCGGRCTPGEGTCRFPSPALATVPPLKHRWIKTWREQMGEVILQSDALVTTSDSARRTYEESYRDDRLEIEVIEHGRDPGRGTKWKPSPPSAGERMRVLVPGNLDVHKGSRLIARMEELDRERGRLEFHVLGRVDGPVRPGIAHGPYEREDFARRAAQIAPSVAAILSICPETYCHTLTEAWAAGIPVVATDIGALGERLRAGGGGWLVPHDDPEAIYERLVGIGSSPGEWEEKRSEVEAMHLRGVTEMAADYDDLYRRVLAGRRAFRARSDEGESVGPRPVRAQVLAPGRPGSEPGSTHVRVLRRLTHPSAVDAVAFSRPTVQELTRGREADVILVQRTSVDANEAKALIAHAKRRGMPLVFELDDDLINRSSDPEYAPHVLSVRSLLAAADHVVTSTQHLATVLSEHADAPVSVVLNALDERLWFDAGVLGPSADGNEGGPLRLLYMGTTTHADDLAILRSVLASLERRGLDAELEVVGGEVPASRQSWYRRLEVPDEVKVYPRFAAWLRTQAPRWDIALAPLEDSTFNRSKSDLKLLEYAAIGLPSIASDVEAFRGWKGGSAVLVPNEAEAWADAIAGLGADATRRAELVRAARRYVRSERCLDSVSTDPLARILTEVGARSRRTLGGAPSGAGS